MTTDAALFDLDGTLLDTLADLGNSMNTVLEAAGYPTHPLDAYRRFVGEGMEMLVRRVLPEALRTPAEIEARWADMRQEYGRRWAETTRPYAGVPEMLDALTARGLPLAILSNKPDDFTRLTVARLLSRWRFAQVRGLRADTPRKPDPSGALAVAADLGVAPARVLYVGDTATDMDTATGAGMIAVGVTWGFRERTELAAHGARHIIDRPAQLLDLV